MATAPHVTPFQILLEYERAAQAHVAGTAEQTEAPGLWRGIGFRLGRSNLMSSIAEVNEILPPPMMTLVPGVKPWLLGIANVRGNLVSVIDLRLFVTGERTPMGERARILVAKQAGGAVGLLVDEVLGQRTLTDENVPIAAERTEDPVAHYVTHRYEIDGTVWGVFSMAALMKVPAFVQAAG